MVSQEDALAILHHAPEQVKEHAYTVKKEVSPYVTYSKNVFIPLTHVCRNRCGYCAFRKDPSPGSNILQPEKVIKLLKKGEFLGCTEALFTFGEKPEVYPEIRKELKKMGHTTIIEYLYELCEYIIQETTLLPHSNPGVLTEEELLLLKPVNASMGLMVESTSKRLLQTMAHKNSPGKDPALRLRVLKLAGEHNIPFTTGILVGIGETNSEIYQSLKDIKKIQDQYGHIQEIIVQNFKPHPGTPMQFYQPVSVSKLINIVVLARLMFPQTVIQVPPNLNADQLAPLIKAGADDLGGISPVTPDYVNPEYAWPDIQVLPIELKERLCVHPAYITQKYLSERIYIKAVYMTDKAGYVRRI
ncbi:MAG: 7,8-didemethyl-8-hydroxy-5-deazariboflavin synthase CofG [Candidatus Methanofastidiosia archaeon]|jgi:FO synthase subunit 1